ncbi:MAG: ParB N-terminal domain-containing protein [Rhodospirillales bacterium]|nr:ParB N-terminal domain-containing protein [Rhodospirillales bacterium]
MHPSTPRPLEHRAVSSLHPARRNPRTHSRKQIRQIADSIQRFGFTSPILIDDEDRVLAGHGRVAAAKLLDLASVPVIRLSGLSKEEQRAYALADNKLALNAGWDQELLAVELQELIDVGFEVELTGFSLAEIDFTLDAEGSAQPEEPEKPADRHPTMQQTAI